MFILVLILIVVIRVMKIGYFYGSIFIREKDGYTENLEFNATETKGLTIRYPYGDATPEEAEAVNKFVKTITDAYNVLSSQINMTNKTLKLEQYAPVVSSSESTAKSAVPQSRALGDGEVSTGAEIEIKDVPFEEAETETEQERLYMEKVLEGEV